MVSQRMQPEVCFVAIAASICDFFHWTLVLEFVRACVLLWKSPETIGLFDGIGALRVAVDALGWNVQGHVSVECGDFSSCPRVVESRFPNIIAVSCVQDVTLEMVKSWAQRFSQVGLVLLGAGPPCQGGKRIERCPKGALRDARSTVVCPV